MNKLPYTKIDFPSNIESGHRSERRTTLIDAVQYYTVILLAFGSAGGTAFAAIVFDNEDVLLYGMPIGYLLLFLSIGVGSIKQS